MTETLPLAPLVLFALAVSFTPGPNVVMVTASAASFGFRRVIPQIAGITLGFGGMVLAVALGLGGVGHLEPRAQALLKYAGAAYLLYLAWRIARQAEPGEAAAGGRPIGFLEAALLQLVNPKGCVSALGGVAAFTSAGGDVLREAAIMTAVLGTSVLASVTVWAAFGTAIGRALRGARPRRIFNWTIAGLLVLSLVPVLW